MKHAPIAILLLICATISAQVPSHGVLEYSRPASWWNEAIPLGNGRLGAMVWGIPAAEEIQLNEETIWSGMPNSNVNPDAAQYLPQIRDLIYQGRYHEASVLADSKFMPTDSRGWNSGMKYQTFGSLKISMPDQSQYGNYRRELSLDDAVATTSYTCAGVNYKIETFTSFADNVIITHVSSDARAKINLTVFYTSPFIEAQGSRTMTEGDQIVLSGMGQSQEGVRGGIRFEGRTKVLSDGGTVTVRDGNISVSNANSATIYTSIATNFVNYQDISANQTARAKDYLAKAVLKPYDKAREEHIAIFKKFMDRVNLDLGPATDRRDTDVRIADFSKTQDPQLVATYFNFGRYLLICSSQEGGQAANLQGIWNDSLNPAWDSKYTTNINLEMNYWPSETCNLSELNEPLFRMISELQKTGTKTAKLLYGADGWVLHHNTDIWRITGPVDGSGSGLWVGGAGWLCRHLWEHYLFTGDKEFLKNIYPIMKDAGLFYDQYMTYEPAHGWLVACPSNSPENSFTTADGTRGSITAGCTMDNEIISDLWMAIIRASSILGVDQEYAARLKGRLKEMAPLQIGRWGQLQEWMQDYDNPKDTHRHVSHLWALYPSNLISPFRTPELTQAAKTSLIARGDPSTGWSMGWKVCLWARLLDGNHALKLITDQLSLVTPTAGIGGTYPNMFDAHRPFQIDGNFGCTAGIAEMLMQSQDGFINILPALPDKWAKGSVTGLVARGGFEVSISWDNGKVEKVDILSRNGGNCRLRCVTPLKGRGIKKAKGSNPNPLSLLPDTEVPLVSKETSSVKFIAPQGYVYDLNTEKGKTYTIYRK